MGKHTRLALLAGATLLAPLLALTGATTTANAAGGTFGNNAAITFSCGVTGACTAPTSGFTQYGMSTVITDVNVTLNHLSHSYPEDLDVELRFSNTSTNVVVPLMSDTCGGNVNSSDIVNKDLTFDDAAVASLPNSNSPSCNTTQTVKPSNYSDGDPEQWAFTPTASTLAAFNGRNPNGVWQISAGDDFNGDTGSIAGGFSVTITTAGNAPVTMPGPGIKGNGAASTYPIPISVTGRTGVITDVDLSINGLTHSSPADLDMLLVSPTGAAVPVMSDACGGGSASGANLVIDDAATGGITSCVSGSYQPTDSSPGDVYPAPAPAGPYGTTMAAFNGAGPNGTWNLYINDDSTTDGGWLASLPTLSITTTDVIAPDTVLVGKKQENTTKTKVKIKFTSTEAGSTFQCQLDGAAFAACTSPFKAKKLKVGKHKLFIKAIDSSGNQDEKPLKIEWKILKAKAV